MATAFRPRTIILFLGDVAFLALALWLSLFIRTFSWPDTETFYSHLLPFLLIFAVSIGVFLIAGLYETRSIILARRAFSITLLVAQTFNVALAAAFFFLMPIFGIAPKTLLGIYLIVSFLLILLWRVVIFPRFGIQKPERAVVIGDTDEVRELVHALGKAPRAPARVVSTISPSSTTLTDDIPRAIVENKARFIIADFSNPNVTSAFPEIYSFLSAGIRFFDALSLYETVFGRIPLSILDERWLAQNVSLYSRTLYDTLKRAMDIIVAGLGGLVSLIFYPFIILAIKLDDRGPIFITQERVGQDNMPIKIYKFRSMSRNDVSLTTQTSDNKVTRVGRLLRMSRLDEIPQLWNVVKGDLSLIGPRPELPAGVALYEKEIPFYGMRHLIKPGLSGWAQLYHDNHPHHAAEVGATREKLSYDLYYLKHRSFTLDLVIVLKTLKKLLTRSGV
jgi:exopolysaccharide biosynthesis polyprenyl glycosylphosphotransferase